MDTINPSSPKSRDTYGFPAKTDWTHIEQLKDRSIQSVLTFCGGFYYEPLLNYAQALRSTSYPDIGPEDVEDWVMEFFTSKLPAVIKAESTRRPSDDKSLFRYLIRQRFKQFVLDQLNKAATQKRGGHLQKVELTYTSPDGEVREYNIPDNTNIQPDIEFDRACLSKFCELAEAKAREEFAQVHRAAEFDVLMEAVEAGSSFKSENFARKLPAMTAGAIRTAKSRLKVRLGKLLLECVAAEEGIGLSEAEAVLKDLFEVSATGHDTIPVGWGSC